MAAFDLLRDLASIETQRRFIVHGTRDEYLLPEELLDNAAAFVEMVESKKVGRGLTVAQREAVAEFGEVLRQHLGKFDDFSSNEFLIEQDKNWNAIRLAAQRCHAALTGEIVQ